jgi:hypothetical protein
VASGADRAGAAKSPGPFFCLYSPECLEKEFSEANMQVEAYL